MRVPISSLYRNTCSFFRLVSFMSFVTGGLRLFALVFRFILCHDVFELRPECFDGGEFIADLSC